MFLLAAVENVVQQAGQYGADLLCDVVIVLNLVPDLWRNTSVPAGPYDHTLHTPFSPFEPRSEQQRTIAVWLLQAESSHDFSSWKWISSLFPRKFKY